MKLEIIATATFGLEAVVKREIEALGYTILRSEDGKITFLGDERAVVRANLWLRTADRVLIKMGQFQALEFEDLFQQIKALPWEEWIPPDGNFSVNGTSVKSKLFSMRTVQSVSEKAIIERLKENYGISHFEKTGADYKVRVTLLKDWVTVAMDSSGAGLHKRGYRTSDVSAPIKETLASAMIQLSFWKAGRILVDPCCGSGTIPIEAAMLGRNQAPGLGRKFTAELWPAISPELWKEERKAAYEAIDYDADIRIYASDIDSRAIAAAKENAGEAGVDDCITFNRMNASHLGDWMQRMCPRTELSDEPDSSCDETSVYNLSDSRQYDSDIESSGIVITNPPYGQRIGEAEEIEKLYRYFRSFFNSNPTWSLFMITSDKEAEDKVYGYAPKGRPDGGGSRGRKDNFRGGKAGESGFAGEKPKASRNGRGKAGNSGGPGRKADRRRKLYNGRLEVCYYQYHGKKEENHGGKS